MTDYDHIEYPSKPYAQCHPDRLAVMARLYGLNPEPPESARILEIGCGDGLNLIASAMVLPQAHFHGIDLSKSAIRRGRRTVSELGLAKTVRLEVRDLRDLITSRKRYHYVIAHGLYSWVAPDVRDALMRAIRNSLAPHGIAFVSYNAYPGAYLRQMVREMAAMSPNAGEWLAQAVSLQTGPPLYRAVLADEATDMLRKPAGALFHDDLSPVNQPCYFREFAAHAASHGLQYVTEANPEPPASSASGDRMEAEQAADFRKGRRFRQSLLCLEGQPVLAEPNPEALRSCHVGGPLAGNPLPDGTVLYRNALGSQFVTSDPEENLFLANSVVRWPAYTKADGFCDVILRLFNAGMLDVRFVPPPTTPSVAASRYRPVASPLARWQAYNGAKSLTNFFHMEVQPSGDSLFAVLLLADGTRNRAAMLRDLAKLYPSDKQAALENAVDQHLEDLRQYGLLTGFA